MEAPGPFCGGAAASSARAHNASARNDRFLLMGVIAGSLTGKVGKAFDVKNAKKSRKVRNGEALTTEDTEGARELAILETPATVNKPTRSARS